MRTRSAAVARAFRSVAIICGARMPNALNSSSMSSRSLWFVADLDRRQVQALVEARRRRHRHPARLDRARLGRVVGGAGPGDQLAVVEDRQHDHLVGVVDAAVQRVVGEPDVAVLHPRVLAVVLEDVLDQDRLDDRVQVRAGGGVDEVAAARVNSAIITSPAMPIELRDERWKTSSASSRMSLVRWKPIS